MTASNPRRTHSQNASKSAGFSMAFRRDIQFEGLKRETRVLKRM